MFDECCDELGRECMQGIGVMEKVKLEPNEEITDGFERSFL